MLSHQLSGHRPGCQSAGRGGDPGSEPGQRLGHRTGPEHGGVLGVVPRGGPERSVHRRCRRRPAGQGAPGGRHSRWNADRPGVQRHRGFCRLRRRALRRRPSSSSRPRRAPSRGGTRLCRLRLLPTAPNPPFRQPTARSIRASPWPTTAAETFSIWRTFENGEIDVLDAKLPVDQPCRLVHRPESACGLCALQRRGHRRQDLRHVRQARWQWRRRPRRTRRLDQRLRSERQLPAAVRYAGTAQCTLGHGRSRRRALATSAAISWSATLATVGSMPMTPRRARSKAR